MSHEKLERYAKWKQLIDKQEKSGLTQAKFCKQHDLVLSTFEYYRSVIKSQRETNKNPNLFSSIQIKKQPRIDSEIKIILPNGFQCIIPREMELSWVKRLIEVLLPC